MAIATTSSFVTPSNLHFISHKPSHSCSTSVRFERARVFAASTTAERRANTSSSSLSLYEVLGVGVGADTLAVKAAYRRLARVLHPDVKSCESSADEFMKVHLAYTTLLDPEKRADYDRGLVQRRTVVSSSIKCTHSYASQRWETDQCW